MDARKAMVCRKLGKGKNNRNTTAAASDAKRASLATKQQSSFRQGKVGPQIPANSPGGVGLYLRVSLIRSTVREENC